MSDIQPSEAELKLVETLIADYPSKKEDMLAMVAAHTRYEGKTAKEWAFICDTLSKDVCSAHPFVQSCGLFDGTDAGKPVVATLVKYAGVFKQRAEKAGAELQKAMERVRELESEKQQLMSILHGCRNAIGIAFGDLPVDLPLEVGKVRKQCTEQARRITALEADKRKAQAEALQNQASRLETLAGEEGFYSNQVMTALDAAKDCRTQAAAIESGAVRVGENEGSERRAPARSLD